MIQAPVSQEQGLPNIPREVALRAVEWLVQLQCGAEVERTRRSLQQWRQEHPDHERAWQHIENVNCQLAGAAAHAGLAQAALNAPAANMRRRALKGLAVAFFGGAVAWTAHRQTPWREWTADARTAVGERRSLRLADGTQLELNTDTAVNIRYSGTERRLVLISGEILIRTAQDVAGRPLIVQTEEGELQPIGTVFNVYRLNGYTQVAVLEGEVQVRPHDAGAQTHTLSAGQQMRFTPAQCDEAAAIDSAQSAWAEGMLVASSMRLADFLGELSRYRPGHLSCDPAVADLRVSGTYPLADTDRILESLSSTLSLRLESLTRYWVRLYPKSPSVSQTKAG